MRYRQRLERAQTAYNRECEAIAEDVRRDLVLPFCRRHRLEFCSGMGTWCFFKIGGREQWDRFELERMRGTKRLLQALDLDVDNNNSIGTSYVRDVREGDL